MAVRNCITQQIDGFLFHLSVPVQLALSRKVSMCNATLPGTHNSAITLADGYGNLDAQFQEYFAWIRWVVSVTLNCMRQYRQG